jgi:glycosyltransferase involved in cell wall biosynthesis
MSPEAKPHLCFISMEIYATLCPGVADEAGGAGFQLVQIARALRDRGYPISFVVGDYGQPFHQEIEGFAVYRANRVAYDRSVRRSLANFWRLWRAIRAAGAQVNILRSTRFLVAPCFSYSRLQGAKFVFMIANMPNCHPDQREGLPTWLNRLYLASLRRADVVTAQTREQQALVRRNFGVTAPLVPNGIDVPDLTAEAMDPAYDVLWVGSLKPEKQPELLLRCIERQPDLRYAVIGGPGADRAYAERIITALAAHPNTEYLGFIPPDQIEAQYTRARVLLNTSPREGFPNTFLYAWSRGIPTCSLHSDPDGLIVRHDLGIVNPQPEALLPRLQALLADPQAYGAMSRRCHDFVRQHHTIEHTVDAFVEALPNGGRE